MKKMQIFIQDFDTYKDNYPLWSTIYVKVDDEYFPDRQWWDATSDVLQMWIRNITRLISGSTDNCVLFFMDGDYSIKLTVVEPRKVFAEYIGPWKKLIFDETIDLFHFARQILSAFEKMRIFYSSHLDSRIIQNLSHDAMKLRTALKDTDTI